MLPIFQKNVFTRVSENRTYVISSNDSIVPDIQEGMADFGLLGSDKWGEVREVRDVRYEPVGKLSCRFVFAIPEGTVINDAQAPVTATSYPRGFLDFLAQSDTNAQLGPIRPGKVEGAIGQGIADAVFDICDSGDTLRANGLKIVAEASEYLDLGGVWRDRKTQP